MKITICNLGDDWYLEFFEHELDESPIAIGSFKTWAEAFQFKLKLLSEVPNE